MAMCMWRSLLWGSGGPSTRHCPKTCAAWGIVGRGLICFEMDHRLKLQTPASSSQNAHLVDFRILIDKTNTVFTLPRPSHRKSPVVWSPAVAPDINKWTRHHPYVVHLQYFAIFWTYQRWRHFSIRPVPLHLRVCIDILCILILIIYDIHSQTAQICTQCASMLPMYQIILIIL